MSGIRSRANRCRAATALWLLCSCSLAAAAAAPAAEEAAWRLEREADGIRVWTRPVADSRHRAIRARMIVAAPLEKIVGILRDTDACRDWARYCAEARVHERLGEAEAYVYTLNDMPWPLADRDVVSRVRWHEEPETGVVHMDAEATEGVVERTPGRVRLTDASSHWTLRPRPDGRLEVTTEAHIEPAGPVPAWITNRLLVDAPFRTMQQLRALAGETGPERGGSGDQPAAGPSTR